MRENTATFHFSLFTFLLTLITFSAIPMQAQDVYLTTGGHISFFSDGIIEDITAENDHVYGYVNIADGSMTFVLLIKAFRFEKALMQEHFNENYMESHIYPKAKFSGKVLNLSEVNFHSPGEYQVTVGGDLTIHGVTRSVTVEGTLDVAAGVINGVCKFPVRVADYGIKIPRLMMRNIAEVVEVTVLMNYKPRVD